MLKAPKTMRTLVYGFRGHRRTGGRAAESDARAVTKSRKKTTQPKQT